MLASQGHLPHKNQIDLPQNDDFFNLTSDV